MTAQQRFALKNPCEAEPSIWGDWAPWDDRVRHGGMEFRVRITVEMHSPLMQSESGPCWCVRVFAPVEREALAIQLARHALDGVGTRTSWAAHFGGCSVAICYPLTEEEIEMLPRVLAA